MRAESFEDATVDGVKVQALDIIIPHPKSELFWCCLRSRMRHSARPMVAEVDDVPLIRFQPCNDRWGETRKCGRQGDVVLHDQYARSLSRQRALQTFLM